MLTNGCFVISILNLYKIWPDLVNKGEYTEFMLGDYCPKVERCGNLPGGAWRSNCQKCPFSNYTMPNES
jgi:hypothetical protein